MPPGRGSPQAGCRRRSWPGPPRSGSWRRRQGRHAGGRARGRRRACAPRPRRPEPCRAGGVSRAECFSGMGAVRRRSRAAAAAPREEIRSRTQPRRLRLVLGHGGAPHPARGVCGHAELVGQKHDRGLERRPMAREVHAPEGLLRPQHARLAQRAVDVEVASRRARRGDLRAGVSPRARPRSRHRRRSGSATT